MLPERLAADGPGATAQPEGYCGKGGRQGSDESARHQKDQQGGGGGQQRGGQGAPVLIPIVVGLDVGKQVEQRIHGQPDDGRAHAEDIDENAWLVAFHQVIEALGDQLALLQPVIEVRVPLVDEDLLDLFAGLLLQGPLECAWRIRRAE